ncbi:MAG: sigma 54-interacting transcriptional regulator [Acidobacteriota bacterium]
METTGRNGVETLSQTSTTGPQEAPSGAVETLVPGLVVVAHPDRRRVGDEAPLLPLADGRPALLSRHQPSFLPPGIERDPRPLADSHLSRRPLRLIPRPGGDIVIDRDGCPTTVEVDGDSVATRRVVSAEEVERGVVLVLAGRITVLLQPVAMLPMVPQAPVAGLVGESLAMQSLRRQIRAAGLLEVPVLVRGETGSGKELVARAVHDARARGGPYLAVNLGALVPSLAASELFGAQRGAYTGADRRRDGYFRRADGGTLFLDEIGEAPVEVQVMLLRTLETGRVRAVGGGDERQVDVQVVAATDADLDAAISAGHFRPALLHRLAGYEIHVPPLRARRDDIARLLLYFLDQEARAVGADLGASDGRAPWPSARTMARLVSYDWPGNVRELKNVARRLVVLRHLEGEVDPRPLLDDLLRPAVAAEPPVDRPPSVSAAGYRRGAGVEDDELLAAMAQHDWQPGPAARALGVSRPAIYRLIERHPTLRTAADLSRDELQAALARHGSVVAAARALQVSEQGLRRRLSTLGLPLPDDTA